MSSGEFSDTKEPSVLIKRSNRRQATNGTFPTAANSSSAAQQPQSFTALIQSLQTNQNASEKLDLTNKSIGDAGLKSFRPPCALFSRTDCL